MKRNNETYIERQNRLLYEAIEQIRKSDLAEDKRIRENLKQDDARLGESSVTKRYFVWSNKD